VIFVDLLSVDLNLSMVVAPEECVEYAADEIARLHLLADTPGDLLGRDVLVGVGGKKETP